MKECNITPLDRGPMIQVMARLRARVHLQPSAPGMPIPRYSPHNRYRLVLSDDHFGAAQTIEFEALSAEAALRRARQRCSGGEVERFEDGRSLGRMRCVEGGGYWLLSKTPGSRVRAPN